MGTFADEPDFDEPFGAETLDAARWIPYYLPHWSTWERAAARYALEDGRLHLLIEEDQSPWCPELDGDLRVSSLQTGLVAGPRGGGEGQHRFTPAAVVRDGPHDRRLYTPRYGRVEIRCTASDDPRLMVTLWMVGIGDEPGRSAEICVCEIFGKDVEPGAAGIGVGVKRHDDPMAVEDFERVRLPIDATEPYDYAVEWRPDRIDFEIGGRLVKTVPQAIAYPMQLMLGVYEFPRGPDRHPPPPPYPKRFVVDRIRGFPFVG